MMSKQGETMFGAMYMVFAAVFMGLNYVLYPWILQHLLLNEILFWRFLLGSVGMSGYLLVQRIPMKHSSFYAGLGLGVLMYGQAYMVGKSLQHVPLTMVCLYLSMSTWIVAFWVRLRKKRRPSGVMIVGGGVMTGALYIACLSESMVKIGLLYAGISAALHAVYVYRVSNLAAKHSTARLVWGQCMGALMLSSLGLLVGGHGWTGLPTRWMLWSNLLVIAVPGTLLASFWSIHVQRYLDATHAALLLALKNLVGVLLGYSCLRERLPLQFYIGVVLLIWGLLLIIIDVERNQEIV